MPRLTKQQFKKLRDAGYSVEKIAEFEKQRILKESPYTKEQLAGKIIPQVTKGLYERVPFGKRIVGMLPRSEEIKETMAITPEPKGLAPTFARMGAEIAPDIAIASPILKGTSLIPKLPGIVKTALGLGAYSGGKEIVEGRPETAVPAAAGGALSGVVFHGAGRLGSSMVPKNIPFAERIGSAVGGGLAGALTSPEKEELKNAMFMAGLGAVFPFPRFGKRSGRYTKNKVLEIRQGAKDYHAKEVKAYGNSIKSLGKSKKSVSANEPLQHMTKMMMDKGLYDPVQGKWVKTLNPTDAKLVKAYESIYRKAQQGNGKIKIGDYVKEYQNIKGKHAKKPTSRTRYDSEVANEMFNGIKSQIKAKEFVKANKRYRSFKENEQAIDKYFDIWGNPKLTGRGEETLLSLYRPEARDVAKIAAQKTGVPLKGAMVRSIPRFFADDPLGRAIGIGAAGLYGIGRLRNVLGQ